MVIEIGKMWTFADGSTFALEGEWGVTWAECLNAKLRDNDTPEEEFDRLFVENVEGYFRRKIVLTKFGKEPWEKEYGKMGGDFAKDMLYPYIRVYLMTWALQMMAKHAGKKEPPKMVALQGDGTAKIVDLKKKSKNIPIEKLFKKKKTRSNK